MSDLEVNELPDMARQTVQRSIPSITRVSIFQRIANQEKAALTSCIDTYGTFIWALARKVTASREEAEKATQEIFIDIWQFARRGDHIQNDDDRQISLIARRRLFKYLYKPENIDCDE